jgi:hypothetical protein
MKGDSWVDNDVATELRSSLEASGLRHKDVLEDDLSNNFPRLLGTQKRLDGQNHICGNSQVALEAWTMRQPLFDGRS